MASADRLINVFNEAKARPTEAERQRFVSEACAGDPELKQQVISLLQAHDGAGGFLRPTPLLSSTVLIIEKPGEKIGRYKLLQHIGEGGCGVVYMAEQEEPVRRRVALKIIKLGMDTKSVIARFEAERQALALMDHPNIAKVFDAGATDTGRPYFVMELVRGVRITDYCDQNNLSTEGRLKLFTQVCHAIQHAHQKGIIHRDIKPSNILVTLHDGVPVPKVIDFGIAKATNDQRLTDKTIFTAFEQFIGTPAYMSPEQAEMSGLDIDTRSDIYSLGVLLYELLTGRTPLDPEELLRSGMNEMRRIIREDEPPRPSTRLSTMLAADLTTIAKHRQADAPRLIHLVHGDLDWIVMKALEKDRTRRYETANGFAMDVQRHLSNEPVAACPPSNLYRFQKLARRNKLAFVAGASVLLVLLAGIAASTWQAVRATRAEHEQTRLREQAENARNDEARERAKAVTNEKKAAAEAAKSQQVAQFMKDMLKGVAPSVALGRDTTMLREIVDNTAERIGADLKDQPEVEIELRLTLAQVYLDLQDYKKMEQTARETLRLARIHLGEENLAVADALGQVGRAAFFVRTNLDEAETLTRQAIAMQHRLRGNDSLQEAESLCGLGDVLRHQWSRSGRLEDKRQLVEAESAIRTGLAIRRRRLGNDNDEVLWAFIILKGVLVDEGMSDKAESIIREGLAICLKIHGADHPFTGINYCLLGDSELAQGKMNEAVTSYRKGLDILERTYGKGKWHQAWAHNGLAIALAAQGKPAEAELHYREALAIARKEMGADHPDVPRFFKRLADFLRANGKLADAESVLREELATQRKSVGDNRLAVATTLGDLSFLLREQGKLLEAESTAREALAIRKEAEVEAHSSKASLQRP
jgi:serine/threonine protein kinase